MFPKASVVLIYYNDKCNALEKLDFINYFWYPHYVVWDGLFLLSQSLLAMTKQTTRFRVGSILLGTASSIAFLCKDCYYLFQVFFFFFGAVD